MSLQTWRQISYEEMDDESASSRLTAAYNALRSALEDSTVPRPWKKKAVNFMVVIFELQEELKKGTEVPLAEVEHMVRQAEDLLNQLNRY